MTELELLQQGCKIVYPSGYAFEGIPNINYIQLAVHIYDNKFASDGLEILNEEGLINAHEWRKKYEKEL